MTRGCQCSFDKIAGVRFGELGNVYAYLPDSAVRARNLLLEGRAQEIIVGGGFQGRPPEVIDGVAGEAAHGAWQVDFKRREARAAHHARNRHAQLFLLSLRGGRGFDSE
eukprot:3022123-Pyramimonas_sp.AAC.1